ncbi:hypothetical protein HFO58_10865 [Rhizobium leguminosarum]|uniref:hypothetical protein n=1 Tax=Rhizobium leguminosarum TaxID=384 RepID=UPI001C983B98|nr:hypothetical protein [Rhizobium leguminosarum]MBY5533660.1 hypothetical protein [Rhizobium leguminosarum]
MKYYARLEVSIKETSVCIVGAVRLPEVNLISVAKLFLGIAAYCRAPSYQFAGFPDNQKIGRKLELSLKMPQRADDRALQLLRAANTQRILQASCFGQATACGNLLKVKALTYNGW